MFQQLQEAGFSKNESKIYVALIENGPLLVGELSSKTKIHRRNVYDSIEKLNEKGLVSWTIRNNRKYFEAARPERILEILEGKKESLRSIMPQLMRKNFFNKDQDVRVYTGTEGRKAIFEDKLKSGGEQLVLGAHEPSEISRKFIDNYHKRRIARKIPLKMLFPKNQIETAKRFYKLKYIKTRILPDLLVSPTAINIYGDKVAFLVSSGSQAPLSILIRNGGLSSDFRKYFYSLWKISRKIGQHSQLKK